MSKWYGCVSKWGSRDRKFASGVCFRVSFAQFFYFLLCCEGLLRQSRTSQPYLKLVTPKKWKPICFVCFVFFRLYKIPRKNPFLHRPSMDERSISAPPTEIQSLGYSQNTWLTAPKKLVKGPYKPNTSGLCHVIVNWCIRVFQANFRILWVFLRHNNDILNEKEKHGFLTTVVLSSYGGKARSCSALAFNGATNGSEWLAPELTTTVPHQLV